MSVVRKVALDSLSYGSITVIARILNYGMVLFHVRWMNTNEYGTLSTFYSTIALLNIIYILGLETSFFRFIDKHVSTEHRKIGSLQFLVLIWSLLLSGILMLWAKRIASFVGDETYTNYLYYTAGILFFDAICSIPFVKLRHQGRTKKYVTLKVLSIAINMALQFILMYAFGERKIFSSAVHIIFIANLVASMITFLLLLKETTLTLKPQYTFVRNVLVYTLPLTFGGIAGMINDTADRIMIPYLASDHLQEGQLQNGIYAANYKLSILIILFTQAYRLGAEPFLFKVFKDNTNPQQTYAKLMHIFTICGIVVVLLISLFIPLWKYWIVSKEHPAYAEGLFVIPILSFANLILGMYFNFSIWFKVKDKTIYGLYITVLAAILTIVGNYIFIPMYGYAASAWITLIAYSIMAILAFWVGKLFYPIPYKIKSIVYYLSVAGVLSLTKMILDKTSFFENNTLYTVILGGILMAAFLCVVYRKEQAHLKGNRILKFLKGI